MSINAFVSYWKSVIYISPTLDRSNPPGWKRRCYFQTLATSFRLNATTFKVHFQLRSLVTGNLDKQLFQYNFRFCKYINWNVYRKMFKSIQHRWKQRDCLLFQFKKTLVNLFKIFLDKVIYLTSQNFSLWNKINDNLIFHLRVISSWTVFVEIISFVTQRLCVLNNCNHITWMN